MSALIEYTPSGFYCRSADIYIDPWKPVQRALITHGHSDHARPGHKYYLCQTQTADVLKHRISRDINIQTISYGDSININGIKISFHPAGHIIGSSQILIENSKEKWVISGDYSLHKDELIQSYEPVRCDYFISETTFGLPVFNWDDPSKIYDDINRWWQENSENKQPSIIGVYSLGKAQRIIQNIDHSIGPVYTHGAVEAINNIFRSQGVPLKKTEQLGQENKQHHEKAMIICPPSVLDSSWSNKIKSAQTAFASGWMAIRGMRRRRALDQAFVLSDHADWKGLNKAVELSGAHTVFTTHGYSAVFAKWLNEKGIRSSVVESNFSDAFQNDKSLED